MLHYFGYVGWVVLSSRKTYFLVHTCMAQRSHTYSCSNLITKKDEVLEMICSATEKYQWEPMAIANQLKVIDDFIS